MNTEINYQFTPVPTQLFYLCDNNTRSVLFTLIQSSSYFTKDGDYFYRTNGELENETGLSRKVIDAALDALYMRNIIDVIPSAKGQGKKQTGKRFRVNHDSFLEYEKYSFNELSNPELRIVTPSTRNHYTPSFNTTSAQTSAQTSAPVTNNIDNIENINNKNNIDNKENINNNKNIKENILENISENILREKQEEIEEENVNFVNNSEYVFCNFLVEENMNLEEAVNGLLSRMESSNEKELNEKLVKFNNWLNRLNLTPSLKEEIEERVEKRYTQLYQEIVSPANNGECDFFDYIEVDGEGKSKADYQVETPTTQMKSREELVETLNSYASTCSADTEMAVFSLNTYCELHQEAIKTYGLQSLVTEIIQNLRNTPKEAVLSHNNTQVGERYVSGGAAAKTPKKGHSSDCEFFRDNVLPKSYISESGEEYILVEGEKIYIKEPVEESFAILDFLAAS